MAKRVFAAPASAVAEASRGRAATSWPPAIRCRGPFVVKPMNEGSSVGVHIVRDGDNLARRSTATGSSATQVLVERFIPGRELTVAVMGDRPLAVTEITTDRGFYDYDAKYAPGGSRHVVPAQVEPAVYDEAHASGAASPTRRSAAAASRAPTCAGTASGCTCSRSTPSPA